MEGFLTIEPRRRQPFRQALARHLSEQRKKQYRLCIGTTAIVLLAVLGITLFVKISFGYWPMNFPGDTQVTEDDYNGKYLTIGWPELNNVHSVPTVVTVQISSSALVSSTGIVTTTTLFTPTGPPRPSTGLDLPTSHPASDLVAMSSEAEVPTAPTFSGSPAAPSSTAAAAAAIGTTGSGTAITSSDATSVVTSHDLTATSDQPTTTPNGSIIVGVDSSQFSTAKTSEYATSSANASSTLHLTTAGVLPFGVSANVEVTDRSVTLNADLSDAATDGGGGVRRPAYANSTQAGMSLPDLGSTNGGNDDGLQVPFGTSQRPETTALALPETACQISARAKWPTPLLQTIPGMPTFRDSKIIHQWMDNIPPRAIKLTATVPIIVASVAHCASVGKDILLEGGSAVDGAIASQICHGFLSPMSAGIGGGFMMTLYDKLRSQDLAIDARESAPWSVNVSQYESNRRLSLEGGLAIAVPNEVAGYYEAWKRYGKVPWKKLFTRTIYWCEQGFLVTQSYAESLAKNADFLAADEVLRNDFISNGRPLAAGRLLRRPLLGRTLRRIADNPLSFYRGDLAKDVLCDLEDAGASWTAADLWRYSVKIGPALRFNMPNYQIRAYVPPPPSLGALVGLALTIADALKLSEDQMSPDPSREATTAYTMHAITESLRFAFARRNDIGDPNFNEEISQAVKRMQTYDVDSIRDGIQSRRRVTRPSAYYEGIGTLERRPEQMFDAGDIDGVHTSVTDTDGISVSISSSIGLRFGSRRVGRRTGIVFNSAMADFSTVRSRALNARTNWIAPGARPASTLVPTIIVDRFDYAQVVTGATGGERGISAVVWTVLNLLELGKPKEEATDQPMLHPAMVPLHSVELRGVRASYNSRLTAHTNEVRTMSRDPRTPFLITTDYEQFTRTAGWFGNSDRRHTSSYLEQGGVA